MDRKRSRTEGEENAADDKIYLRLPCGTRIPAWFSSTASQSCELMSWALEIAATGAQQATLLTESHLAAERQSLSTQTALLLSEAAQKYSDSIARERANYEKSLRETTEAVEMRLRTQLQIEARAEAESRAIAQITLLKQEMAEVNFALAAARQEAEHAANLQARLSNMQQRLDAAQQEKDKEPLLLAEIKQLFMLRAAQRKMPSKLKGADGEAELDPILHAAWSMCENFSMMCVEKDRKSGDRHISLLGLKLLIESKNYEGAVPLSEIQKFQRDSASPDIDLGILISLRSEISNHKGAPIVYKWIDGKAHIFINVLLADGVETAIRMLQSLRPLFEVVKQAKQNSAPESALLLKVAFGQLVQRAEDATKLRKKIYTLTERSRKELDLALSEFESDTQKQVDNFKTQWERIQQKGEEGAEAEASK